MTYLQRAVDYARRVVDGVEAAGKLEIAACARFLRDLDRIGTDGFDYLLNERLADRACSFVELLRHVKGKWARPQVVDGEVVFQTIHLEDWQVFIVVNTFGWVHRVTGLRRFRRAYLEVARKNAKSTLAAGIALYMLVADNEPGSLVFAAATTGDQARLVFDDARNMVKKDRSFRARFGALVGVNDISCPDTASTFKPLNAEASTQDGLNVHCAIIDELHAHKKRHLFDVINDATGARDQSLILMITTAGTDRAGICYEQRGYSVKVLQQVEGFQDETWFAMIFTLDGVGQKDGDDWTDPRNWRKANPNLGVSLYYDDLASACLKAQATPSSQANFFTKRLNIWVNADQMWIGPDDWRACGRPGLKVNDLAHLPCMIAYDLASKVDYAAKVYVFRDVDIRTYFMVTRFYLPERAVEESQNAALRGWVTEGWVRQTDGEVIDFGVIEDELAADMGDLNVVQVGYDPWQATQMANNMTALGVPMVEVRQTVQNMSEPMKQLQACVLNSKPEGWRLVHDNSPVMEWMVSNVVCHLDAKDNVYPRKERPENKIDGPVAGIMGLGRWVAVDIEPEHNAEDMIVVG